MLHIRVAQLYHGFQQNAAQLMLLGFNSFLGACLLWTGASFEGRAVSGIFPARFLDFKPVLKVQLCPVMVMP